MVVMSWDARFYVARGVCFARRVNDPPDQGRPEKRLLFALALLRARNLARGLGFLAKRSRTLCAKSGDVRVSYESQIMRGAE